MTPKQKANELFFKYYEIVEHTLSTEYVLLAKKCALIVVDEMLNYFSKETFMMAYPEIAISEVNYWTEVKQEIEKL